MKTMKRICLAAIMLGLMIVLIAGLGTTASAATYGDLTYSVSNGEVTITDCKTSATNVEIPKKINGYPVTAIGEAAFYKCESLTRITIPDSVTTIGTSAFDSCYNLINITIPGSIVSIGHYAFGNCTSLTSVIILDGVTSIVDSAFSCCKSLTSITIPNSVTSIESAAFYDCIALESITIPDSVTSIGSYAFYGCKTLDSISIPNGVKKIESGTFKYCYLLQNITIPNSVTSIGSEAFYDCNSLTNITIPRSVTSIGDYAFYGCNSFISITIPDGINKISPYAFQYCSSLSSINIPDSITNIGKYAFDGCGITSFVIPDSVKRVEQYAFSNCSSLKSVIIPDGITYIHGYAFENCNSLKRILYKGLQEKWQKYLSNLRYGSATIYYNIDNDYKFVDNVLFNKDGTVLMNYNSAARLYVVPEQVTSIETRAFMDFEELQMVILPENLQTISSYAFYNAKNLTSIYIPASVSAIEEYAFCYNDDYNYNKYVYSISDVYFGGTPEQWKAVTIAGNNSLLTNATVHYNSELIVEDSVVYNKDKSSVIYYNYEKTEKSFTVPSTVKIIATRAFKECTNIKQIVIPSGVTTIKKESFYNCKALTSVNISKSVKTIENKAFYNCAALDSVSIPDSVTTLGDCVFENCSALKKVTLGNGITVINNSVFYNCFSLKNITFPANLKTISSNAFSNCISLKNVVLPEELETIGNNAFSNCTALTYISLPGSIESLGDSVFESCSNLVSIYIPEGKLSSIPSYTFSFCESLAKIYIPANIKLVGSEAFLYCQQLNDLYYGGTEADWNNIRANSLFFINTSTNIHINHKHNFGEWSVIIPAGNNSFRVEKNRCNDCGYEKRISVDATHVHKYTKVSEKNATCTAAGYENYECSCELDYKKNLSAKGHNYKTVTTKATLTKGGKIENKCTDCGDVKSKTTIYYPKTIELAAIKYTYNGNAKAPGVVVKDSQGKDLVKGKDYTVTYPSAKTNAGKYAVTVTLKGNYSGTKTLYYTIEPDSSSKTVTLSATSYTYNGKAKAPSVTVKDSKGKTLVKGTDYTVTYSDGRINPGKYAVKVTFKGNYSGTVTKYYLILPGKTSKVTATTTANTLKAEWNKVTGATGYKVEVINSSGTVVKTVHTRNNYYTFSGLTTALYYKVKVTSYKTIKEVNNYSLVSATISTYTKPATPTFAVSSTTKGKANFTWSNVNRETGYQVYCATSENGTYSKVGTYAADSKSGSKSSLTSGKTYYFKVRAYKKVGDTVIYSGWSTVKSVKIK